MTWKIHCAMCVPICTISAVMHEISSLLQFWIICNPYCFYHAYCSKTAFISFWIFFIIIIFFLFYAFTLFGFNDNENHTFPIHFTGLSVCCRTHCTYIGFYSDLHGKSSKEYAQRNRNWILYHDLYIQSVVRMHDVAFYFSLSTLLLFVFFIFFFEFEANPYILNALLFELAEDTEDRKH